MDLSTLFSYAILFGKERSNRGVEDNEKQYIRQQIKQKQKKLSTRYLRDSEEIQKQILMLPEFRRRRLFLLHISVGKEVSTELILTECFRQENELGVPLCTAPGIMEVRQITCMDS